MSRKFTMPQANALSSQARMPRERKQIDPSSTDFNDRFALHLRAVMERKKWSSSDLVARLQAAGMSIDTRAVDTWLRGDAMPKAKDLETVGQICGFRDYRFVLPPPISE